MLSSASQLSSAKPFEGAFRGSFPARPNAVASQQATPSDLPTASTANSSEDPNENEKTTEATRNEQTVTKLKSIDAEVRAHEAAHLSAAGGLAASGASFQFTQGPDGKLYAVGGEVKIDMRSGNTPQETIARAQQIRSAALAPANPSPQDLAVAGHAAAMESQAREAITQQQIARFQSNTSQGADGTARSTLATDSSLLAWA